jgi:hypothetical protein
MPSFNNRASSSNQVHSSKNQKKNISQLKYRNALAVIIFNQK